MVIIEIKALENGAHRNQTVMGSVPPPDGWAVIPEDMEIPETFPFVNVEATNGVVTAMTAGTVPVPEPKPEPEPTVNERVKKLETENGKLKSQIQMQAQQQEFLENCLLEMGDVVYA